jgi:beta-phosphoglucomutase
LLNKLQLEITALAPGLCLIFDMDGVIVDSNPVHRQAWAAFNRRFGLETTEEMLRRMYGKRNDQIVRDFFGEGLTPEEVARRGAAKEQLYRDMVKDRIEEILVPGVRQFLERHRDVPKALATNGEEANVDFLLDRAGLRPYFRAVVNGQQVRHPKPHPEIYQRAAGLLGADPANCIVFEDSDSGVEAARAAGMRIVLLCTTHGNLPGASLSVDNFLSRELSTWLLAQGRSV